MKHSLGLGHLLLVTLIGALASSACNCGNSLPGGPDGGAQADGGRGIGDAGESDGGGPADGGAADGNGGVTADGGCYATPVPTSPEPSWVTGSCPDSGCPTGTTCLNGQGEFHSLFGCAPIAAQCAGTPSCACMGCICAYQGCAATAGVITCPNGTISRRSLKEDVVYIGDEEREQLARQTLRIPLARYRYNVERPDARRRLGFLIDDQPDPSPAVDADRTHVDEYGYTSMLLATVQQQSKEIERLRRRLEALERRDRTSRH